MLLFKRKNLILIFILVSLVIFGFYYFHYRFNLLGECGNDDFKDYVSPNGQHTAQLYRRNCGATTDYVGHITLDNEKIFVLNHYYEDQIEVEWLSDNHLFIQYAYRETSEDASILKTEYQGIKLEYFYWPCMGPVDKHPEGYCLE